MSYLIMYLKLANSINDYMFKKYVFQCLMLAYLFIFSCLQNHLDLAHRNLYICFVQLLWTGILPTAAAVSLVALVPRLSTAPPVGRPRSVSS